MNEAAIRAAIEPVLARHHLELDRLDIVPAGSRSVVRVTVDGDGPAGRGPLLDDIASASRDVSEALDAVASTGNRPYTLEVSSRGTSSPLTDPKHFRRNTGRLVRIVGTDGSITEARIAGITDDAVLLVDASQVPFAAIKKATVQVELNRPDELDDADADDEFDAADDEDEEDL